MGITRQLTNKLRHVLPAATFAIISSNFTGCVSVAPPQNSEGLAMSEEPKYLIFLCLVFHFQIENKTNSGVLLRKQGSFSRRLA